MPNSNHLIGQDCFTKRYKSLNTVVEVGCIVEAGGIVLGTGYEVRSDDLPRDTGRLKVKEASKDTYMLRLGPSARSLDRRASAQQRLFG
jgi:hypothetical protein